MKVHDAIYRGHIPELDAFRAFGITMMVAGHFWPVESYRVWKALLLCWALMDTFFVISGFLIVGILIDSRERPEYYRSYYIRRTLRIFPIYYLVLIVMTAATLIWGPAGYAYTLANWGSLAWFFVYAGNIPSATTGIWPTAAGGSYTPLWSLQVEEQFYLLTPFLIRQLSVKTMTRLLWAFVFISPALRIAFYFWNPANTLAQYVLLPCHMDGLALGGLIAIRFRSGPWKIAKGPLTAATIGGIVLTVAFCSWAGFAHDQPLNRTVGYSLASFASALIVLWLVTFRGSRVTALLRIRPVQHLGKVSYGMYLMHYPVGVTLVALWPLLLGYKLPGLARVPLIFVVTLALGSLSWRYFEAPVNGLRDRLSVKRVPAGTLASRGLQGV